MTIGAAQVRGQRVGTPYEPPRPGLYRSIREVIDLAFVDAVREGMPRFRTWPRGLLATVVVALCGVLTCIVMIFASPWIRQFDAPRLADNQALIGSWSLTVLMWLMVLTLALGLTANLHLHIAARFFVVPLLLTPAMVVLLTSLTPVSVGAVGGLVAAAAILGFTVIRVGRSFAWFEFPVMLVLTAMVVYLPQTGGVHNAVDFRASLTQLMLSLFTSLAVPSLLVVGFTAAQLTISFTDWTVDRTHRLLYRPATIVLAVLLGMAATWRGVALTLQGDAIWTPATWVNSVVLLAVALVGSLLVLRLRPDKRLYPVPPDALSNAWAPLVYPLAFLLVPQLALSAVSVIGDMIMTLTGIGSLDGLTRFAQSPGVNTATRLISAAVAVVFAVRLARRNDRITPVLLVSYASILVLGTVRSLTDNRVQLVWEADVLAVVMVVLMFVLAAVLWLREGRDQVIWKQVLLVAGLATLFGFRQQLSEPSMVFAGISGSMVMVVSLVWRLLTDGALTRHSSKGLPQTTRVLFFMTSVMLSAVALAWVAQTRIESSTGESAITELGDHVLGKPLLLAAGIWALIALVGRLTDDEPGERVDER
ncbi:hypothetical protein ACQB6R_13890 [Propionibacteriaceae bacterium G1746]